MAKTFLRGLALLESIDLYGPLTITELAQRSGVDKTVVSRMIAAAETDGWVLRTAGRISVGPRAALLGLGSPTERAARRAEDLVHAASGVTGQMCQAYALVGTEAAVLASASGRGPAAVPVGLAARHPLWGTAAGKAIAAQLSPEQLDRLLPKGAFPDVDALIAAMGPETVARFRPPAELSRAIREDTEPTTAPADPGAPARNRDELDAQLIEIRHHALAVDLGEILPELACIAAPWPQPGVPAALAVLGPIAEISAALPLVTRVLRAAAAPGSTAAAILAVNGG